MIDKKSKELEIEEKKQQEAIKTEEKEQLDYLLKVNKSILQAKESELARVQELIKTLPEQIKHIKETICKIEENKSETT